MPKTRSRGGVGAEGAFAAVKRERVSRDGDGGDSSAAGNNDETTLSSELDRRVLLSKYLAVMNLINGTYKYYMQFLTYMIFIYSFISDSGSCSCFLQMRERI